MAKTIPADEQVFMVSKSTNTTYSGSASLKAMNEWYTMDDVSNTVQPYKVFTALLTQSGGDNPDNISVGTLTIGVTYRIEDSSGNPDFTIVGSPNNLEGTSFIATGTTPNWGNDAATLSFNTGAPVATALENTIGNVWFTYIDDGAYFVNSNLLFIENKTTIFFGPSNNDESTDSAITIDYYSSNNQQFNFRTYRDGGLIDNQLYNTAIEIRVYN